jgi:hypothetical protein
VTAEPPLSAHGLDRRQLGPVAIAGHHRVPLVGSVLEPPTPSEGGRAVLGMTGPVHGLDHAKAVGAQTGERLCVVLHQARVKRGSNGG